MTTDNDGLLRGESEVAPTGSALFVSIAAALGGFLFGYDTAVINGTTGALEKQWGIGSVETGIVVSSALLGCAVGAWFAGTLANKIGRPKVMMIAAVVFFITSLGSALATGPVDLTIWRIVGGFAIGAASVIAPAYIAEISPAHLRGRLGSLQQFAIVLGIFGALIVNYGIQASAGGASGEVPWGGTAWRWMFAAAAIPAFVYFMFSLNIPESPRYLVAKQQLDKARKVLLKYVGGNVDHKIIEIQGTLDSDHPPRISDVRGSRLGLMPIVWVGILLSMFQQFVGINVIFYYSTSLWQSVGFSESDAFLTSVINSVVNIAGTILAIYLVDRIGRKKLLLMGSALMFIALGTMAVIFASSPWTPTTTRSSATRLASPRSSRRTCSCSGSRSPGARSCGCCSGRCSPTASAPPRSAWPPPRSGSPTGSSPSRSRSWPRPACSWRTACTRCSR
nr:hypothetical protein GCM10025732_42060 [Glycomyces mayteni]